jgi:hypothetical protein
MGWKTVVGTASVLVAAAGGCWWAVAASAAPPAPVIGPALVVTPASGASPRPSPSATLTVPQPDPSSPSAMATGGGESPEVVDPQWVRPVDDDGRPEDTEVNDD